MMEVDFAEPPANSLAAFVRARSQPLAPKPTEETPYLPKLEGIRAVVFDIYGTIFMSASGDISLAQAESRDVPLAQALCEAGLTGLETAGLAERFHACIAEAHKERRVQGIEYPEVEIREVWQAFLRSLPESSGAAALATDEDALARLAIAYETAVNPIWPMPWLAEMLAQLRERGLALGIVSNAQFYTQELFPAFLGASREGCGFPDARCVWSHDLREGKPSRRLYQRLAESLKAEGILPHEAIFVGNDMRNDIWPAQLEGFRTALFAGDARSLRWRKDDTRVQGVKPDAILTELSQLPGILLAS